MATGYQYKLLENESQMMLDEEGEKSQRDPSRTVCLVLIIFCLMLAVIGLFIALIFVKNDTAATTSAEGFSARDVCMTPKCIALSAEILKNMDREVNPCSDMYRYACGGWIKDSSLPPGYGRWSQFSELYMKNGEILRKLLEDKSSKFKGQESTAVAKLKSYYRTCMDLEKINAIGTTVVKEIIRDLGPWSVTSEGNITWVESRWDFQNSLISTHRRGSHSFFDFGVTTDSKDTNKMVIKFSQAGLTLGSHTEYSNNRSQEFKEAFLSFASELGELLGGTRQEVRTKMEQVYDLEKELSQIFVPLESLSDPYLTYNKMTLKEFQDMIGQWVNIQYYLTSIFGDRSFLPTDTIIVSTPQYFEKLGRIVEKTDREVLANYMMWSLLQGMIGYLPESFVKAVLPLAKAESGVAALPQRWKKCFSKAADALGFAMSALYVDSNFKSSSKEQVVSALHKVTQKFVQNLDSVTWLDDITRQHLKEKVEFISYKVGYPDWIMDPKALDEFYGKLVIKEGEFLISALQVREFDDNYLLSKYGKPSDKSEWSVYPHTVNAFYSQQDNEVVVPAGILQPPFFSPEFPKPFLYGTIGMVVGHEMTHGFDDKGRKFDKNGNLGDQWTRATSQEYEKKARCIVQQYENYTLEGHHLNGNITLNENIADNGGLLMAYRAFKDDPTPQVIHLPGLDLNEDQMFFLGFSQIWCSISTRNYKIHSIDTARHMLGEFRVKGVTSNFPEFATAFNCPANSSTSSHKMCRVW